MTLFSEQRAVEFSEADLQRSIAGIAVSMGPAPHRGWDTSPFRHFKARSPTITGRMFEALVSRWLEDHGVHVSARTDSGHDRLVDGQRAEIKGATLCPEGTFLFNQIRDQDYAYAVLLGLTPSRACMWVESKDDLRRLSRAQHAGNDLTRMLIVGPDWIGPRTDGSLSGALSEIRAMRAAA